MKNNYLITKMQPDDLEILNNVMKRSTSLWRYPSDKMELIINRLALTSEFMGKSVGYVAKLDNIIKGFFAVTPMQEEGLNPAKFYIVAQGFYEKLGAIKVAERPSTIIKEHMIPIMQYIIIEN
jgi:hypothetical protein